MLRETLTAENQRSQVSASMAVSRAIVTASSDVLAVCRFLHVASIVRLHLSSPAQSNRHELTEKIHANHQRSIEL